MKGEARCLALLAFMAGVSVPAGSPHAESQLPKSERSSTSQVVDYASLHADLRARKLRVKSAGKIVQPFFNVAGRVILVNGQDLQVFQYPDAARTNAQAALVSPDGLTVATTKVHWLAPPHFYKRGKLLVIYLGDDRDVLRALEGSLGPQFAGKS